MIQCLNRERERERFLDNSLFIGIEVQHCLWNFVLGTLQGPFRPAATSSAIPAVAQAEWETRAIDNTGSVKKKLCVFGLFKFTCV